MLCAVQAGMVCLYLCLVYNVQTLYTYKKCNNQEHARILCLQSLVILLEPAYLWLHFFRMTLKVRFLKALRCLILLKSMGARFLNTFEELAL